MLFTATCAAQAYALYAPSAGGPPLFSGFDKVVHVGLFAVPILIVGLRAGPYRWAAAAMAVHAPLSELIQWRFIPNRSGDLADLLADWGGVLLALLVIKAVVPEPQYGLVE